MITELELKLLDETIERQTRDRCGKQTPESMRRRINLTLKISKDEMEYLKQVSGGNVSEYVRKMILGEKVSRKV